MKVTLSHETRSLLESPAAASAVFGDALGGVGGTVCCTICHGIPLEWEEALSRAAGIWFPWLPLLPAVFLLVRFVIARRLRWWVSIPVISRLCRGAHIMPYMVSGAPSRPAAAWRIRAPAGTAPGSEWTAVGKRRASSGWRSSPPWRGARPLAPGFLWASGISERGRCHRIWRRRQFHLCPLFSGPGEGAGTPWSGTGGQPFPCPPGCAAAPDQSSFSLQYPQRHRWLITRARRWPMK